MTRAQAQEIAAALLDVNGWLRQKLDTGLFVLLLLVSMLALFNALRAGAA